MPVKPSFLIQVQKAASWTGLWLCLESHCLPLSGSFDWTNRLMHNGLSWRVAAGELCCFSWSALEWLGLVWSVPACCVTTSVVLRGLTEEMNRYNLLSST